MITRRAYSLVGMLMALACMVILFAIGMNAMSKRMGKSGATEQGTVHSMQDQMTLVGIHQALVVNAQQNRDRLLTPSLLTGSDDRSEDTTANFYSAMVMQLNVAPKMLISANERSDRVWEIESYDHRMYDPGAGVYWDPAFKADLDQLSHVSFGHMPMYGVRFDRYWEAFAGSRLPWIGSRGPRDGQPDLSSWTYNDDGTWAGHMLFEDGHVEFLDTFNPPNLVFESGGETLLDNLFAVDDGADGADAIISFTREMTKDGPVLQFD
jgi:hypothetical protein